MPHLQSSAVLELLSPPIYCPPRGEQAQVDITQDFANVGECFSHIPRLLLYDDIMLPGVPRVTSPLKTFQSPFGQGRQHSLGFGS